MKINFILFFLLLAFAAYSQTYLINTITDGAGKYRYTKHEIRQFETVTDTLLVDVFPEKWCDSTEFSAYTVRLITALSERQNELRRLFQMVKQEADLYISFYDQKNRAGAYLALQKSQVLSSLAGTWKLVDRNGETTTTDDVTITGSTLRKNANKFGTLSVTDDIDVLLTGYFNFDLTFKITQNGTLRAQRNGRIFTLKRA